MAAKNERAAAPVIREPTFWEAMSIDDLYSSLSHSLFSPGFSVWFPVILYPTSEHSHSRSYFLYTLYWFFFTLTIYLLNFSSRVWRNKSWKGGFKEIVGTRRVDWDEQIVVVTGGCGGVGRTLVEILAVKGLTIAVIDVVPWPGQEFDDVHYYHCDLSSAAAIATTANRIKADLGDPTILINNAAVIKGKLIVDLQAEDVEHTFAVNISSHYHLLRAFLPAMIQAKTGHIVSVTSALAHVTAPQTSDYGASKAAVINLHESLRWELDSRHHCPDIRTTLVTPGQLLTPLFASVKPINKFLFPLISPHDLVKPLIQALDAHESREISLPVYARWCWIIRGCGVSWVGALAEWVSGAGEAMVGFQQGDKKTN